ARSRAPTLSAGLTMIEAAPPAGGRSIGGRVAGGKGFVGRLVALVPFAPRRGAHASRAGRARLVEILGMGFGVGEGGGVIVRFRRLRRRLEIFPERGADRGDGDELSCSHLLLHFGSGNDAGCPEVAPAAVRWTQISANIITDQALR